MKKQLLSILVLLLVLVANFTFAQQNRSANVSTSGTHTFNKASLNPKASPQVVPTTTTSTCMSINLPAPATWSLVNYGTGTPIFTDGFVNGPNIYNDKEKAMYFDASASANTMITQVYVGFDHAYSATPTKTVAVRFYDGTSGTPGASIGQGTLSMSTIMSDVAANRYSLIMFPTPLTLPASKRFFASVDITALSFTTATKDSLSIVSNTHPQTTPSRAWEKWSNNSWVNMGSSTSWSLNISLLIHPFLTQAPIVSSITVSTSTICTGQSITYSSTGSTPGTYDWYFGAATTSTATGATANTTYTTPGTYTTTMIVEDACGSFGIASGTINVNLTPTVSASPNSTTVCNGANVTLNGGGASSYAWTGGITNNVAFTPPSTANYTVIGTASNGCTAQAVAAVVVNPNPTITVNSGSICSGQSFTMTPSGASTYTFSSGSAVVNPTGNTSYSVTGTNAAGCISTSPAVSSVTVNPNPTIPTLSSNSPVCVNSTINLVSSTIAGASYQWSGPGGFSSNLQNPTSPNATVPMSGTYTAVVSIGSCTSQANTIVTVNPLPTPLASNNSPVCAGQTINFTGSAAATYTWTGPASFTTNIQNPTIPLSSISNSGNYTLTVTDANNCVNSVSTSVIVNPLPTVTANSTASVICVGQSVTLNGGGASTYTWSGSVSDGVAFTPTVTDTYTVTGTDGNGCMNMASISVSVSACTGMQQFGVQSSEFVVYPNPNNGDFTISLSASSKNTSVEIYNTIGKLVYTDVLTAEKNNFNTNLAAGIYFINIIENGKVIATQKLICK